MNKLLIGILVVIAVVMGYFYYRHPLGEKIIINGHTLNVEVAVTNAEKEKGLGDRSSLAKDSGMLFVYQNKDRYGYWMKGMRFPLDFIWINGNVIVDFSRNIPFPKTPNEAPVELAPTVPVDKVLEVNAGVIDTLGVKTGDTVQFSD